MSSTVNRWVQQTPNPDLELFVGASEFVDVAGVATLASAGAGLFTLNLATTAAGTFFANISAMLKRTGVLATPALTQEQFGTAASQPGPSSVSGTSGPLALPPGFPPIVGSKMATLAGSTSGPQAKGVEIISVDIIYTVATVNASLATVGLTDTVFVNAVAPAVTNRIALGANGLPVAYATTPYRKNVAVASPVFPVTTGTETILNVNLTAGNGGTVVFYGAVVKANFNLN